MPLSAILSSDHVNCSKSQPVFDSFCSYISSEKGSSYLAFWRELFCRKLCSFAGKTLKLLNVCMKVKKSMDCRRVAQSSHRMVLPMQKLSLDFSPFRSMLNGSYFQPQNLKFMTKTNCGLFLQIQGGTIL